MNDKVKQDSFSGLAIAALITGILSVLPFGPGVPLGIAAVVLGAIDANRIKVGRSSQKSKGMAIAGIVLGAVGMVITTLTLVGETFFKWTLWSKVVDFLKLIFLG